MNKRTTFSKKTHTKDEIYKLIRAREKKILLPF